jgi:hypothetical protein
MRFDTKIVPELNLTPRQHLFAEVWFNQVHEYSLDAFRVRTMNPVNIMDELTSSVAFGNIFSDADRKRVVGEAVEIIKQSPLIHQAPFATLAGELTLLLSDLLSKDKKDTGGNFNLIDTFGRELRDLLRRKYVHTCITWLSEKLNTPYAGVRPDADLGIIEQVTGQLLSCLISAGWSFESLFSLYRRAFSSDPQHTPAGQPYEFRQALAWLFDRLAREPKPYVVTFAINQFSNCEAIPPQVGDITFSQNPPVVTAQSPDPARRLARAGTGRLFATMTVNANDSRIAGMRAAAHIEQVLDVVRYDFIHHNFSLSDRFLVEKAQRHILLTVSKTVPNEKREATSEQLHDFMEQLANLVSSGILGDDSKDRIYSAFRLYRTGAESANLENKLVNWWTALEFLVRAGGNGGIGDAVENALFPTVTLSYMSKHLNAIRGALQSFSTPLTLTSGEAINLSQGTLEDLYGYCKDAGFQASALGSASSHPYAELYLDSFFKKIMTPKAVHDALLKHETAVRWQIQRIYRARCDIVHSAGRVIQAPLLCANLESYLKSLLDAFLKSCRDINTLRTPREFFDRQRYALDRIKSQLLKSDESKLLDVLRTGTNFR